MSNSCSSAKRVPTIILVLNLFGKNTYNDQPFYIKAVLVMNKKYLLFPFVSIILILFAPLSASGAPNNKSLSNNNEINLPKSTIIQQSTRPQHASKAVVIKRPGMITHPHTTKRVVVKKTTPLTIMQHHRNVRKVIKAHKTNDVVYRKKNISIQVPAPPKAKITGKKYRVRGQTYYILPSSKGYHEKGIASWYGKPFHGRKTANGETYNMYNLSAAHKSLPLNSVVKVKNLKNNKEIILRITDRGPFKGNRVIDLSYAAAKKLGMVEQGLAKVEIKAIG